MPTSSTTDLILTAGDAIKSAMVELGVIGAADEPEDSELEEAQRRLNNMLKTWSVEANLFREESATVVVPGGTGAVSLPSDVRDVNSVRHIISSTYQRALAPWNRSQYTSIPNRASTGFPVAYYYQQGAVNDALRIWPVPVADVTLDLDYSRGSFAVEAPTQTLDVPTEWHEAVLLGLASRIASMFGTTRLDPATVARIDARAEAIYQRMLDADRPDSYIFEHDRGGCGCA